MELSTTAAEHGSADYIHTPTGTRQRDLTVTMRYDRAYLEQRYGGIPERMREMADLRARVLSAFQQPPGRLLDYGCGVGAVVDAAQRAGWDAVGCDIVPGPDVLDPAEVGGGWDVVTFFDSLEHLVDPAAVVASLDARAVFVSVPWCHLPEDQEWFMGYYHRRPGEHLWHWSRDTLVAFFAALGYRCVMTSSFEDVIRLPWKIDQDNILSGLFVRKSASDPHR